MAARLLIRNVTLIDGTGAAPALGTDVVIQDGVFAAVGPGAGDGRAAEADEVVDGGGRFLVPGLWEGHTHLRHVLAADEEASQAALDETLRAYLRRGITSVVD